MSGHVLMVNPGGRGKNDVGSQKTFTGGLAGKVVGIVDNSKPNFDRLADEISELLARDHGVASVVRHRKRAPSIPATDAMMREFEDKCDLVIAGSGD